MQFDLIAYLGQGSLPFGVVFDFEAAKKYYRTSYEIMERGDDPGLSESTILFDGHENVLKFRFYINEQPPDELISKATSRTENATFRAPSGTLCAGWEWGFILPDIWISRFGSETRDGFLGQFQQVAPGDYRADLFCLMGPPTPADHANPPAYIDDLQLKPLDVVVVLTSHPAAFTATELKPAHVVRPGFEDAIEFRAGQRRWEKQWQGMTRLEALLHHQRLFRQLPESLIAELKRASNQQQTTYYKVDSRKLGYGEYWRLSKKRVGPFIRAVFKKLVGIPIDFKFGGVRIDRVIKLDPAQIPIDVTMAWRPRIIACRKAGLQLHFYYTIPTLSQHINFGIAFLNPDGRIVPQIFCIKPLANLTKELTVTMNCVSRLNDRRTLVTMDQTKKLDPYEGSMREYMPGAPIDAILARHYARLNELNGLPVDVHVPNTLEAFVVDQNRRFIDARIAKCAYIPMTEEEVELRKKERDMLIAALSGR